MVKVRWTDYAIENLNDIGNYIGKDSIKYAEIIVTDLFNYPDVLSQYPLIGRVVLEFNNVNIRELIRGNYRIVYKILNKKLIDILVIHHSAQLLTSLPE